MACPHTLKPTWCSTCAGVAAKHITIENHVVCEDGRPTGRQVDDERRQVTARKTARFRRRSL